VAGRMGCGWRADGSRVILSEEDAVECFKYETFLMKLLYLVACCLVEHRETLGYGRSSQMEIRHDFICD
jgi:hypothetical protein